MDADRLPRRFLKRTAASGLPPAIILGIGPGCLAVARALAAHGVAVLAVDWYRRPPACDSGAWDVVTAPDLDGDRLVSWLAALPPLLGERPVLFPMVTRQNALVSEVLRHGYRAEVPGPDAIDLLSDKARFARHAEACGWPIPRTLPVTDERDLPRSGRDFPFPAIIKPRRGDAPSRLPKAVLCRTPDELLAGFRAYAEAGRDVVVQEWIPGGDNEVSFSLHYHTAALA